MAFSGYASLRVLIVDDFDSFRTTLKKIMVDLGVQYIDSVASGEEGLEKCLQNEYDLILCDYNLGPGKNGQQLLEELRYKKQLKHESIFILLSAEANRDVVMSAYDYEPDGYLTKPVTGKTLQQRLDRIFTQRENLNDIYHALNTNDKEKAIALLEKKIQSNARLAMQCQKMVAALYIETGAYDLAENIYRAILEVRTLEWAQVGLAKVKMYQGEIERATHWLSGIISKNPNCLSAYDALAEAYKLTGNSDQLQTVLDVAVTISPMSILRQLNLAQVATDNNDMEVAAIAYRKSVKLSPHSCYHHHDHYVSFARSTADLYEQNSEKAKVLAPEANRTLNDIQKNFPDMALDPSLQSTLINSRLQVKQGEIIQAQSLLDEAQDMADKSQMLALQTEIDWVNTLESNGYNEKAKSKLKKMIADYQYDQLGLQKIDRLLSEPVSELNRKAMAVINKEGIVFYQQKQFIKAIEFFARAEKRFPRHVGVRLNLMQAIIGEMREYGSTDEHMDKIHYTMDTVTKMINTESPHFKRYLQLKEMLRGF